MASTSRVHDRQVIAWLLTGSALVALMVVVGGATRLTDSGLSMVEWKPLLGALPPLSEAEWIAKFEAYKLFPEYAAHHSHFTLSEFKSIFWWEYLHRVLGRVIGVVFLVPFLYFCFRRCFRPGFASKTLVLFVLGGFQGVLGWYMVKSGLIDNPDVSHYRLALHLFMAFVLYGYAFWLALTLLLEGAEEWAETAVLKETTGLQWGVIGLILICALQVVYGAFVAGLKAGLLFPTFPKMGAEWIPQQVFSSFSELGVESLVSDMVTVQFIHRVLGCALLLGVCGLLGVVIKRGFEGLPRTAAWILFAVTLLQVVLGVLTLLYQVPFSLGVMHQLGALLVFSAALFLLRVTQVCPLANTGTEIEIQVSSSESD